MSNVTFTLQVKAFNLDQKFAFNGLKIYRKSVPNRSRKRVCFEVAFQIDFGRLLGRLWVPNGRRFAVRWPAFCCPDASRAAPSTDAAPSFLSFQSLSPFKAASEPILKHFGTDFESILGPKIGSKWHFASTCQREIKHNPFHVQFSSRSNVF